MTVLRRALAKLARRVAAIEKRLVAGLDFSGSALVGYTSNNPGSAGVIPPVLAA